MSMKNPQLKVVLKKIISVVLISLIGLGIIACQSTETTAFVGQSMSPTIKDGEAVSINKRISSLQRGDIVAFYNPTEPSQSFIKRVIGLPGETIEIKEGSIVINGLPLDEPYLSPQYSLRNESKEPIKIAENSYYVRGDNRKNSFDSRSWGTVPRNLIWGKIIRN